MQLGQHSFALLGIVFNRYAIKGGIIEWVTVIYAASHPISGASKGKTPASPNQSSATSGVTNSCLSAHPMVSISLMSSEARNLAQRIAPRKYSAGIDLHVETFQLFDPCHNPFGALLSGAIFLKLHFELSRWSAIALDQFVGNVLVDIALDQDSD